MPGGKTVLTVPLESAREQVRRQVDKGIAILRLPLGDTQGLVSVRRLRGEWRTDTTELLQQLFTSDELAQEFKGQEPGGDFSRQLFLGASPTGFAEGMKKDLERLESIESKLESYVATEGQASATKVVRPPTGRRVFVVHGRDSGAESAVALLIRKVGLEPVILHELPNQGSRSLLEKLIAGGEAAEYAVVALTADDIGALATEEDQLRPRARQNVVLELGYFLGLLGPDRVCALLERGIEEPSDYSGIVYIPYDDAGAWRYELAKALRQVWDNIDLNAV